MEDVLPGGGRGGVPLARDERGKQDVVVREMPTSSRVARGRKADGGAAARGGKDFDIPSETVVF